MDQTESPGTGEISVLKCPKCGFVPKLSDKWSIGQCLSCGLVFRKYADAQQAKADLAQKRKLQTDITSSKRLDKLKNPTPNKPAVGAVIFGVLVLAFGASSVMNGPSKSGRTYSGLYAQTSCEEFVKGRLKSPSSASFPFSVKPEIIGSGSGPYTVVGQVDSQNGFGAMIRSGYRCEVSFSGDTAKLIDLIVY